MVHFWKNKQIEICFKPMSCFGFTRQWFFSISYDNNDKTKIFYFTVFGLHFFYIKKKRAMKKFEQQAESVAFKVGKNEPKS